MSDPDDFTVGWICGLPTELTAACSMLDEELPRIKSVAENDSNNYTVGRLGPHKVAITILPDGERGTVSAATVASDMLHTFTNIRFGLIVGIGGGAPTAKRDIRLGDVVVSRPGNGYGGVFQYDFGKTIQGRKYQHTGYLDQPPTILRAAVSALKARHESDGHQIQQTISQILEKKPRLKRNYSKPPQQTDCLWKSAKLHPFGVEGSCATLCGGNTEDLIARSGKDSREDDPVIHYGLIASGNSVIKDATLRDELAASHGVLCFETEAAGLLNNFRCIVIRGVCNYADTHNNKAWQGYAAMTAAAYAKELLLLIAPERMHDAEKLTGLLDGGEHLIAQGGEYGNALQAASEQGHTEIVALLLDKDANVNTQGGEYSNALQAALEQGHTEIVKLLKEREVH